MRPTPGSQPCLAVEPTGQTEQSEQTEPSRPPGRVQAREQPEDERRDAVCAATLDLLAEIGYQRLTTDAVALRAHASKATIYRYWSSKLDLVVDSLTRAYRGAAPAPHDTGSLRGDLLLLVKSVYTQASSAHGQAFADVMIPATRQDCHAASIQTSLEECRTTEYEPVIERAIARGELTERGQATLAYQVLLALVLTRDLWRSGPSDGEDSAVWLVDDVLLRVLMPSGKA